MTAVLERPAVAADRPWLPEPLAQGDRLRQPEFHRRYQAMPDHKKIELIDGMVHKSSPVSITHHAGPHHRIVGWLSLYESSIPHVEGGDNATLILDSDNEVQPDALLRLVGVKRANSRVTAKGYLTGAPEFIFEIAASSVSYDLHQKKEAYRRSGVQEYAVWRTSENAIDWWQLIEGDYQSLPRDEQGSLRSAAFPGLVLDVQALLEDRKQDVQRTQLEELKDHAEHAAFIAQLSADLLRD